MPDESDHNSADQGSADGETIFALASGRGPAGIAVFRLSGPRAGAALRALSCEAADAPDPPPRLARRVRLTAPGDGALLDDALVLWFPAPASFTGEDVVELHVHGGRAVIEAVARALGDLPGLSPAEPGDFSRRAFTNGKLDLTQAEGLADLVAAETEAQRKQALAQLGGALGTRLDGWRERLISLMGEVEAAVDFAEEEIPDDLIANVVPNIKALSEELTQYLDDDHRGERLRDGFFVAIVGAPNVGKSSLLNALVRREAAIVSASAGTTRDVIEVHLDLGGLPVILADTAGLRDTDDVIEAEGVRRAEDRARSADLRLVMFDASRWPARDQAGEAQLGPGAIAVLNKIDLNNINNIKEIDNISTAQGIIPACAISARSGDGLAALIGLIRDRLDAAARAGGPAPLTRERHRRALTEARDALIRAAAIDGAVAPELMAEELRQAARSIGRITGAVDVEDVLDRIFSQFCIGK